MAHESAVILSPKDANESSDRASTTSFDATRWLVLSGLVSIAALLRCQQLGEISLWFDESFCWKMTTFDWSEQFQRIALDNHPPFYFLLLKGWADAFGDSPVTLRILSLIFGLVTVVGAFLVVDECTSTSPQTTGDSYRSLPGLTAAGLVALSPFQIAWSQQIRMYSLGAALTVFSCWLLLRALRRGDATWRDWTGYVIIATLLLYTHYYALFVVAAQVVYGLGVVVYRWASANSTPAPWLELALSFWLISLLWLPWLPIFLDHRQQVQEDFWTKALRWEQVTTTAYQMVGPLWNHPPPNRWTAEVVAFCLAAIGVVGVVFGRRGQRLLALVPLVTFVTVIGLSWRSRSILSTRYFLFAQTMLLCTAAAITVWIPWNKIRGLVLLASFLTASGASYIYTQNRAELAKRPGFQAAIDYLETVRHPGEPVVVANPLVFVNAAAYIQNRDDIFVIGDSRSYPYYQGAAVMREREFIFRRTVSELSTRRVWVLDAIHWAGGTWITRLPEPWVDVDEQSFADWYSPKCQIVVRECVRRPSTMFEQP